jgi:hypothetical protein
MNEQRFWSMIEDAWKHAEGSVDARRELVKGELSEEGAADLAQQSWDAVVPALQAALEELPQDELLQFDRILERKLYDIDRDDIHEYTDGGDDGFLYCRAFIVAAGKDYYDAVSKDPSIAMMDLECEDLCYLPVRVFEARFGEIPDSGISRETGFGISGKHRAGNESASDEDED